MHLGNVSNVVKSISLATAFSLASFSSSDNTISHTGNQPHIQHIADAHTDNARIEVIQRASTQYATKFAHPATGMIRERSNNIEAYGQDIVATGASGFGMMTLVSAHHNGWITTEDYEAQLENMIAFLEEAPRFHGAFAHFYNPNQKTVVPFSEFDNGGDLVETSLLAMGMIAVREYNQTPHLNARLQSILDTIEWNHYTNYQNRLYWHWSLDHEFAMDLPIEGWNEGLIAYVMAAGADKHAINPAVYHNGWAQTLPDFNHDFYANEPLFISQYSFLGLDPRGMYDRYQNFDAITRDHALAHYAYQNAHDLWGETSCDGANGYNVFTPADGRNIYAPTAFLTSMPFTPRESFEALQAYQAHYPDMWGEYGFYDSNASKTYVCINKLPSGIAIQNYRDGLFYHLIMNAPEIQRGLKALDFESPYLTPTFVPEYITASR